MRHESRVPRASRSAAQGGFSLLELVIAMGLTLAVLVATATLGAAAFSVRRRENDRTEALAEARRALGSIARELEGAGFNLPRGGYPANGIVTNESGPTSVRFLSNRSGATPHLPTDQGEDVRFQLAPNPSGAGSLILRHDYNAPAGERTTVVADSVDSLAFRYFAGPVNYQAADCDVVTTGAGATPVTNLTAARFVVITICVNLPPAGAPGSAGYQPGGRVQLSTAAAVANSDLTTY